MTAADPREGPAASRREVSARILRSPEPVADERVEQSDRHPGAATGRLMEHKHRPPMFEYVPHSLVCRQTLDRVAAFFPVRIAVRAVWPHPKEEP